jgi:hypothetical protein
MQVESYRAKQESEESFLEVDHSLYAHKAVLRRGVTRVVIETRDSEWGIHGGQCVYLYPYKLG